MSRAMVDRPMVLHASLRVSDRFESGVPGYAVPYAMM